MERATDEDHAAIWAALEPVIRAGETLALPRDMTREEGLAYWFASGHEVFVARLASGELGGTYFVRANQGGGGSHVANCAYVTAAGSGGHGLARAMAKHSLVHAKERGFRAMQFNFVVASNGAAVHLWTALDFAIAGTLPAAFHHPSLGDVDALVMFRRL
ncbi:MAG: GNAT family N-acetyltransferase [Deltaproteobacteria bacterium]|nr:GNAT family N-acetyltransferase [Deltaproteobacteria bacterium]